MISGIMGIILNFFSFRVSFFSGLALKKIKIPFSILGVILCTSPLYIIILADISYEIGKSNPILLHLLFPKISKRTKN